jgi:hypothetical protein
MYCVAIVMYIVHAHCHALSLIYGYSVSMLLCVSVNGGVAGRCTHKLVKVQGSGQG